jgi:hypothetical protein
MKNLYTLDLNRDCSPEVIKRFGGPGNDKCGVFNFKSCIDKAELFVMAASSPEWEFVSIQRKNRTPNWMELEQVRKLIFEEHELVVQFHFGASLSPNTLYLWHPISGRAIVDLPPYPGLKKDFYE